MFFQQDKKNIPDATGQLEEAKQILARIAPVSEQIYSNKAARFVGKSLDFMMEILFYLLGVTCVGFVFIMNQVFPFHVLGEIMSRSVYKTVVTNAGDMDSFNIAVKGLVVFIGVLFVIMGMMKNSSRNQKNKLQLASIELKHLETIFSARKEALEKVVGITEPAADQSKETSMIDEGKSA